MNKTYFEVEDDVVIKYIPVPEVGENIHTTEVAMTKEAFQECYKKWIEPQEGEDKKIDAKIDADVLDKIRAGIMDCLNALDEIERTGVNIYLPNEISGRRLTYQQCLEIIDKYKAESEDKE